jgi:hypothetical protein
MQQTDNSVRKVLPVEHKIAVKFRIWLRKHPKATHEDKVEKFDEIADELIGQ